MKIREIFIVLLLFACEKTENKLPDIGASDSSSNINTDTTRSSVRYRVNDVNFLQGKVFEMGGEQHLTDSCTFSFECDCCFSHLIFNYDSSFLMLDYCVDENTLKYGKYAIMDSTIILNFDGKSIIREYNYAYETDTTVEMYNTKITLIKPYTFNLLPEKCNNQTFFREPDSRELLSETSLDYHTEIEDLKKGGYNFP